MSVTIAELLYSSRPADEMASDLEDLSLLEVLHIDAEVEGKVTWIMRKLAPMASIALQVSPIHSFQP